MRELLIFLRRSRSSCRCSGYDALVRIGRVNKLTGRWSIVQLSGVPSLYRSPAMFTQSLNNYTQLVSQSV